MAANTSELMTRLIDMFGPVSSADPTKLYGNLMVSPAGNILIGSVTDNGTNKLQVTGSIKTTVGVTFPDGTTAATANTPGALANIQMFTASGTYTPTTGVTKVIVEIQAAGGGGGGCVASNGTNCGVSQCGGAGGYILTKITSGFSGASVVVGAAGIAGTTAGAAGGTGGSSSFAGVTAVGGGGGAGSLVNQTGPQNTQAAGGGSASGGTILNLSGQYGTDSNYSTGTNLAIWGTGGSCRLGSGAKAVLNSAGINATGYGSGGGGIIQTSSGTTARAGGAGSPGIVIVWEYY